MNRHLSNQSHTHTCRTRQDGVALQLQEWAQKEAWAAAKPRPPGAYNRSTACLYQQTMRPVQCAHLRKRERFRRARSQQAEVRSNSLVGPKKKLSGEAAHRSANMRLSTSNECICCSVGTALVKPATACHASPSSCSSAKGTTWAGATIASEHRVHRTATLAAEENNLASRAKITYQRFYHTTFWLTITTAQNNLPSGKIPRATGKFQTLIS